jgi:hypothetical protein
MSGWIQLQQRSIPIPLLCFTPFPHWIAIFKQDVTAHSGRGLDRVGFSENRFGGLGVEWQPHAGPKCHSEQTSCCIFPLRTWATPVLSDLSAHLVPVVHGGSWNM